MQKKVTSPKKKEEKPDPKIAQMNREKDAKEFNKRTTEYPMNSSLSKASFGFAKAKRFGESTVNTQGYVCSILGTENQKKNKLPVSYLKVTYDNNSPQLPNIYSRKTSHASLKKGGSAEGDDYDDEYD